MMPTWNAFPGMLNAFLQRKMSCGYNLPSLIVIVQQNATMSLFPACLSMPRPASPRRPAASARRVETSRFPGCGRHAAASTRNFTALAVRVLISSLFSRLIWIILGRFYHVCYLLSRDGLRKEIKKTTWSNLSSFTFRYLFQSCASFTLYDGHFLPLFSRHALILERTCKTNKENI